MRAVYRIIDANLDRIGEGLRVLEDIARLELNDPALSQELKNIRHEVVRVNPELQARLLESRDAAADVGMDLEAQDQKERRDLAGTITANAKRVQEALRVLEEMARQENALTTETFRHARFAMYTIEKRLVERASHTE